MTKTIIDEQIAKFYLNLKLEEKSYATIKKYISDVRNFLDYLKNQELAKDTVIAYKDFLISKKYAIRSINSKLASLNSFFLFLGRNDLKVKYLKLQQQIFRSEEKELRKTEYERLLSAAKVKGNSRIELVLQTICATGIRVSELKYITLEAVKLGEAVVSLKGKVRTIIIVKRLQKKLLSYAKAHNIKSGMIFITRNGKAMNRINIWREMKELCRQSNVNPQKVFPHNLRHLFARTFYSVEKDIAKLADILGHSNITTTRIYLLATGCEHRNKLEKMRLVI